MAVFIASIFVLMTLMKYNTRVIIWEKGLPRKAKARKIQDGRIVEYELLSSLLKKKKNREVFTVDHAYIYNYGGGLFSKSLINLMKVGDGAYHPVPYSNPSGYIYKISNISDKDLDINGTVIKPNKIVLSEEEYKPIKDKLIVEKIPQARLETVNQQLLWWFTNKIRSIQDKYKSEKWWVAYLPFGMFMVSVVLIFIMWVIMMDKVGSVGGACTIAENKITNALSTGVQKII